MIGSSALPGRSFHSCPFLYLDACPPIWDNHSAGGRYLFRRWNIDSNDAGWSCDHGIARVWVRITVGLVVHTFVVYMNPLGMSEGYPSSPPGFTAETVGKGVIEIDLRERFSEDEVFSNIFIDLSNQDTDGDLLTGTIGFLTLCPK